MAERKKRIVVGISGASGAVIGVRLLAALRRLGTHETHLIVSSSGAEGMVIAPCSMKTLAGVANGFADNLLTRAADVMLKERRRLVLVARETPLNLAHLRNMTLATEMGAIVMPPVPAFYAHPQTIEDVVDHTVGRILDLFGIEHDEIARRWSGLADEFGGRAAREE
jgi:2,5-furandicarboxylate decarboxylase 2